MSNKMKEEQFNGESGPPKQDIKLNQMSLVNSSKSKGAALRRSWKRENCDFSHHMRLKCDRNLALLLITIIIQALRISEASQQQQQIPSQNSHHHHLHHHHNHNQLSNSSSIIIDQQAFQGSQLSASGSTSQQLQANNNQHQSVISNHIGLHLQPAYVYGARNRSLNFTHLLLDELTGSVYIGATNWLFQLSAFNLKAEYALKTGPSVENQSGRDCAPAECLAQIAHIDLQSLNSMHHAHGFDLTVPQAPPTTRRPASQGGTMHTASQQQLNSSLSSNGGSFAFLAPPRSLPIGQQQRLSTSSSSSQQQASSQNQLTTTNAHNNNYNKILAIDAESRQLIVCGSLNQGACRRHQLGQLTNFSDLIPSPVAANDEHSSSLALVVSAPNNLEGRRESSKQKPVMYVAATNSGPYREMVPAISARYLEPASRAMQIIERSFTDSARIDISFELRDYYLVNYVHTFQHNEFIYFATIQRKSPLRQFEEWGYITRLARLCLSDLSFQSYTEITLECSKPAARQQQQQQQVSNQHQINYNLLQDAYLTNASSHLANQLGIKSQSAVLVGAFAQSKDHTSRSQQKSAICLYPMERIEQKFNENIHMCYNGSSKARNMNYIAGSVNDCPKAGKAGNIANFCNEPLKLNGSLPLQTNPVLTYDDQLITAIAATQAPTSPISQASGEHTKRHHSQRQHQVLIAGTSEGAMKRIALVSGELNFGLRAVEFDSVQVSDHQQEPILADLHLFPSSLSHQESNVAQFALLATPHKVAKLRVNSCGRNKKQTSNSNNNNSLALTSDECYSCAQLQDPYCGWCSNLSACATREECHSGGAQQQAPLIHWSPFDQIKCADYQPVSPQYVALQTSSHQPVDVNIRLPSNRNQQANQQLALQLAQAQFTCHFDYLALATRNSASIQPTMRIAGATTKATQARLNLHTSTVVIGCPLPAAAQRPPAGSADAIDHARARLSVRLASNLQTNGIAEQSLMQLLGMKQRFNSGLQQQQQSDQLDQVERELTFYDCSVHASCSSCLSGRHWSCQWCPLSNRCTFNSSHPDFGCAASAIISTTPNSATPGSNMVRASHLTSSLDEAQASVLGTSFERLTQCLASELESTPVTAESPKQQGQKQSSKGSSDELLIPNNSRRSIQVHLKQPLATNKRSKFECLLEVEGAKARVPAKLVDSSGQIVSCQEQTLSYQEEIATLRAQLLVIHNDNQVIDITDVILYKCHLFGVSPPALTSTVTGSHLSQHSTVAWRPHELLQSFDSSAPLLKRSLVGANSDCSLCLNVDRKYQCAWCNNRCQHADQCTELQASTCPPPRIDSIHPTSGPLEGGTLLTIEGSNLGSNEREIQDKILVGGEPCQLYMYSVSTRIVCKTGPSQHGAQLATVFVGNRAGVTSAFEKFHYKSVHLTDVNPRIGPVSGGTRLYLTGSNLNIGSRVQIFLDDIPCTLDSHNDISSHQISCITAPNLLASSTRITRLTLMIDNSTHYLPYPFTYLPDPIITNIEPAESFVSGGRLILITGQHLSSPQSIKLMVHHEYKHNILNGTTCSVQNDTLITCLTPAISRDLISTLLVGQSSNNGELVSNDQANQQPILSYESGGLKLKMSLFMDDVKSVRNLDEYYHHLPHYLTYFDDPQLFRLPAPVVDYSEELVIVGENLFMKQLDQDMQITIGAHICTIKSITAHQVVCEPPAKIAPIEDENGRQMERPQLPIVALIGANLRYQIGHMQYHSRQYQLFSPLDSNTLSVYTMGSTNGAATFASDLHSNVSSVNSPSVAILISLSVVGFIVGLGATLVFALSRFRQSKAEREYKRIQLQMGSLDINGQPLNGALFDTIHVNNNAHLFHQQQQARSRALDYVGCAISGKKLFHPFNQAPLPTSPLTDISSLTGTNPLVHNQHVVKLSSNGTIINSSINRQQQQQHLYNSANSSSSQSSPNSTRNSDHLFKHTTQNNFAQQQLLLQQNQSSSDKSNLLIGHQTNGSSRNYSWTQEAPSTIVPYAVIEACNLTLEGKNAIKEYV